MIMLKPIFTILSGLFVISALCSGNPVPVQDTTKQIPRPDLVAVKVEKAVNLTGKLDDPLWSTASPVELKFEISPGENIPAGMKTEVMVLYDLENLYFGFRCHDTLPGAIRANLSDRDKIFSDDYVIISIDTYNNFQRGFEFAVNAYGIQGDLLLMGPGNEDPSYDMVWHSAASRNEEGWTAEIAIPFKSLTFSPAENQSWTINLLRNLPRNNRYRYAWTKLDRNNPSYLAQGGNLVGLDGIRPGNSLEFLPYIMAQKSSVKSDLSDPESSFDGSMKARIGGGVQYSPGPNISINAVINPDFSQIESDADQVTVNTTFALYYPEKRPFFMSGMDLLQTPMYYSRTINNPLFASKVNGKAGKFSYLALAAYDRNSSITVPGEEESNTIQTTEGSYAGVGRLRYDIGNESFIGVLLLSRNFESAHNYLTGLDWNIKFWKNWYWQAELFLTETKEINDTILFKSDRLFGPKRYDAGFNGEKYYGTGMHMTIMRQGRNYSFSITQNNFSPTYQTYNGMFPEVGQRTTFMNHRYTIQPNKKILKSASLSSSLSLVNNYEGILKNSFIQPALSINLIGQTGVYFGFIAVNRERFRNVFFNGVRRGIFELETAPVKGLRISVSGQKGRFIYRTDVPELGNGYDITTSLEVEPFSRLKTSFSWTVAELHNINDDVQFYKGHIMRNITTLQFTRLLFLRNILQYNTFSDTFNIYPLLTYKFNAFTMFCAGMTQDLLNYNAEDYTFRTSGYQYFIKLQYLFRR